MADRHQFAVRADAPRFLRGSVGVTALLLFVALQRLMRPAPAKPDAPDAASLDRAAEIVRASHDVQANLALLGDKSLLFSDAGNAFVMYGVSGKSFVALGDPVGAPRERQELGWRFRELADRHGAATVFYEVRMHNLPLYLDLGLSLLKLGELNTRLKKYTEAAAAFKRATQKTSDPKEKNTARYGLAWAYYQSRMFKEAEDTLVDLISANPDGTETLDSKYLLARSRLYVGDYLPAISGFEEIADKYKDSPLAQDALMGMAEAYERHNELYKAIAAYKRILTDYPDTDKKAEIVRVYLPPDANTLLVVADQCLRSTDCINVIVAEKPIRASRTT